MSSSCSQRPQIISLGSQIGSGLFIATGKALRSGGPGSLVLGYGMVCSKMIEPFDFVNADTNFNQPVSGRHSKLSQK